MYVDDYVGRERLFELGCILGGVVYTSTQVDCDAHVERCLDGGGESVGFSLDRTVCPPMFCRATLGQLAFCVRDDMELHAAYWSSFSCADAPLYDISFRADIEQPASCMEISEIEDCHLLETGYF